MAHVLAPRPEDAEQAGGEVIRAIVATGGPVSDGAIGDAEVAR